MDLYLDQTITKEEFKKKSAELDELLEKMVTELNDISSITTVKKDVRLVVKECLEYASEVIDNARRDEEFIKDILEEMVVYLDKTIVIKLIILIFFTVNIFSLYSNRVGINVKIVGKIYFHLISLSFSKK